VKTDDIWVNQDYCRKPNSMMQAGGWLTDAGDDSVLVLCAHATLLNGSLIDSIRV